MTGFVRIDGSAHDMNYLSYDGSPTGVNIDFVTGTGTGGDAQGDTFSHMNAVLGSQFDDTFRGSAANEDFYGLAGNDRIIGGGGYDRMIGGTGADTFVFEKISDSLPTAGGVGGGDTVTDFSSAQGDKVDLKAIDADGNSANGDTAFTLLTTTTFSGAGAEVIVYHSSGNSVIVGDLDGDKKADFGISMLGVTTLSSADFIL